MTSPRTTPTRSLPASQCSDPQKCGQEGCQGCDEPVTSRVASSLLAAEALARCQRRLANQLEQAKRWRERAISAEQALGLYGPKKPSPVRRYATSYCDEATDSGHSSSNGLGGWS